MKAGIRKSPLPHMKSSSKHEHGGGSITAFTHMKKPGGTKGADQRLSNVRVKTGTK